jgi:enoyl-CoA hydratase/carnithine racemase
LHKHCNLTSTISIFFGSSLGVMNQESNSASVPVLFEEIRCDSGARIGVARLNFPASLNSLSLPMVEALHAQLRAWRKDAGIVLVMLEASGDKAFCAGADLHKLHETMVAHHASARRDDIRGNPYALAFFGTEYRLDYLIHTYSKPVLCWGHGIVMGGGVGLMSGASHRVVTETTRVAMPEINIGLFPDVGGSWLLNRAPGRSGLFLALTAAQMNAEDALFAGFGDYKIAHARKSEVMTQLSKLPWNSISADNARLLSATLRTFSATDLAHGPLRQHLDMINTLCDYDDVAEIVTAITSIKTDVAWLSRAAATLTAGSPSSAALGVELQRRLVHCSLAETFRAELVAALTCAARPDLTEGIRALLIDKDRKPKWRPASLAEFPSDWLDGYFSSPWTADQHPLLDLDRN